MDGIAGRAASRGRGTRVRAALWPRVPGLVWTLVPALLCPLAAAAEPPSGPTGPSSNQAFTHAWSSFDRFCETWMKALSDQAGVRRKGPAAGTGGGSSYVTYGEQLVKDVKPTGRKGIPYVGTLRYLELHYECADPSEDSCVLQKIIPITEIFRYQGEHWIY